MFKFVSQRQSNLVEPFFGECVLHLVGFFKPHHHIRLSVGIKSDFKMWLVFSNYSNRVEYFPNGKILAFCSYLEIVQAQVI